jgi:hypothetical protein
MVARTVLTEAVPFLNEGQLAVTALCSGVFLAAVECRHAADAVPQHAHRDWKCFL